MLQVDESVLVERKIRQMIATEDLASNKAIVPIVEDARNRISTINKLLVYDEKMESEIRKLLIREKAVHQFYLDRFDGRDIEARFEMVGKVLDDELASIQDD